MRTVVYSSFMKTTLILCLIVAVAGCGLFGKKEGAWKPVKPKSTAFVHTVRSSRETIRIIAKWYTGDTKNWNTVADANPAITPEVLSVGDTVYIPSTLLKTRTTMPTEFVNAQYRKPKSATQKEAPKPLKSPPKPAPPEEEENELELFGPK